VSVAPDVLDALVLAIDERLPVTQVLSGWDRSAELDDRVCIVGFAPTPGAPAWTSTLGVDDEGFRTLETIAFAAVLAAWDGDTEYDGKRARVYEDLGKLRELLVEESKAARRLGGLIVDTYIGANSQTYQEVDEKGATVQIDFQIIARAYGQ
jgi:hypothetical protein